MTKPTVREVVQKKFIEMYYYNGFNPEINIEVEEVLKKLQDILVDEEGIKKVVIENTLRSIVDKKENTVLVFKCCGNLGKKIEVINQCPWCNEQNIEVINLWKFKLIKAIADDQRGKLR